jgi:hypothetical protein
VTVRCRSQLQYEKSPQMRQIPYATDDARDDQTSDDLLHKGPA